MPGAALRDLGTPIVDIGDLDPSQRDYLARYFAGSVELILTPLAADAAHPFPFISNLGLNLAVLVTEPGRRNSRFVRIKVPPNRPRWVPLPDHAGWVPPVVARRQARAVVRDLEAPPVPRARARAGA